MNHDDLIGLKKLKLELDCSYEKQYRLCELETSYNFLLKDLEEQRLSLISENDRLVSTMRLTGIKKKTLESMTDIETRPNEVSRHNWRLLKEVQASIKSLDSKIKSAKTGLSVTSARYRHALSDYEKLKERYAISTANNEPWQQWCREQEEKTLKIAKYAKIPKKHYDTLVVKMDEEKNIKIFFGRKSKIYDKNSKYYLIRKDGSVHRSDQL